MNDYNVVEELAKLEHQQWQHWSRGVSTLLERLTDSIKDYSKIADDIQLRKRLETLWNEGMKTIVRWKQFQVPYDSLDESIKDLDREWAIRSLQLMPSKCPIWQCGGFLVSVKPEGEKDNWQTPDLICVNCGAMYKFSGFKKNFI